MLSASTTVGLAGLGVQAALDRRGALLGRALPDGVPRQAPPAAVVVGQDQVHRRRASR